jgi:hypothetical protein
MSARVYAQAIGAGATIRLPAGRYFYIKTATFALTIVCSGNTVSPATFINIGAGAKFGPVAEGQGWRYLDVSSANAQSVEIVISDDGNFEIASAVTVAGTASFAELPSSLVTSTLDLTLATATETTLAGNLTRRRIVVGVLSTSPQPVRVRSAGAMASGGEEIQPGMTREFKTTADLTIRNDNTFGGGTAANWYAFEES